VRAWSARISVLLMVVLVSAMASLVQSAWACGCGAMVSNDRLQVDGEASIVRWDGSIEQIVMRLAVDSEAADAAWIFPTPTVATVQLGHREWFTQIEDVTRPTVRVERDWWPPWKDLGLGTGAQAPGRGSVNLLDQQQLGPFVVATLDATDAGALSSWLSTNGYRLSPELAQTLGVYVKQRWKYVAVKLAPQSQARAVLNGELDPLHLSFDSDRLVYPMYISNLAKTPQHVHVWVVAPHRVERVDPDATRVPAPVRFAGPATGVNGSLGDFIGSDKWLTEFQTRISRPASITADWEFAATATDAGFREVEVDVEPVYILGVPGGWFIVGMIGGSLAVLLVTITVVVAIRRKPVARVSQ